MSSEDNNQPIPWSSPPSAPPTTYHPARERIGSGEGSDGDDDSDMDYDPHGTEVEYYDAESSDESMPGLLGRPALKI